MKRQLFDVGNGVAISGIVRGEMPPDFLLVHGLASNALLWDGVGDQLLNAGRSSLAVDQRGHGLSSKPDWGFTHPQLVEDLAKVVSLATGPQEPRPCIAVGQSWGAAVVALLALAHPERVAGVVLVDGGVFDLKEHFKTWDECASVLAPPELSHFSYSELAGHIRSAHKDWGEEALRATLGNLEELADGTARAKLGRAQHMQILHELYEYSPGEVLSRLNVPVLALLAMKHEQVESGERRERLDALVKATGLRTEIFVDGDHDLHAQYPERVADLLLEFESGIGEAA
ncbi:MAG: alpha/beta hydrolase [Actinomycetota bacterium]|nr:alpha/beta hydrolase [Actinomycetota bacterium]